MSFSPEDLWVLNPKRLFKSFRFLEDKESDPVINKEFPNYGACDNGEYRGTCTVLLLGLDKNL